MASDTHTHAELSVLVDANMSLVSLAESRLPSTTSTLLYPQLGAELPAGPGPDPKRISLSLRPAAWEIEDSKRNSESSLFVLKHGALVS